MGRVIGQTGKIGIRTGLGEDLGVTNSDHASSLSLQRPSHDGSATALRAACNDLVDELEGAGDLVAREPSLQPGEKVGDDIIGSDAGVSRRIA